jgi:hypothetical protein
MHDDNHIVITARSINVYVLFSLLSERTVLIHPQWTGGWERPLWQGRCTSPQNCAGRWPLLDRAGGIHDPSLTSFTHTYSPLFMCSEGNWTPLSPFSSLVPHFLHLLFFFQPCSMVAKRHRSWSCISCTLYFSRFTSFSQKDRVCPLELSSIYFAGGFHLVSVLVEHSRRVICFTFTKCQHWWSMTAEHDSPTLLSPGAWMGGQECSHLFLCFHSSYSLCSCRYISRVALSWILLTPGK